MNKLPVFFALALSMSAAHAEFKDGNKLLRELRGDNIDQVHAMGYVIGVADALRGITHCPPSNVTVGQLSDMVKQHLEASPSTRHLTADVHVGFVLKQAWPCANNNSKGTRGGV
jgi:hypothetical protein